MRNQALSEENNKLKLENHQLVDKAQKFSELNTPCAIEKLHQEINELNGHLSKFVNGFEKFKMIL